jgi:AcrR family transcriptional regulator
VSPRPAPSRHDATARQFLKAAAALIDAYLDDQPLDTRPARLKSIRFPAALDWLRTEDVIRLAGAEGRAGVSRKAFFNRWPTRDEFLPDAIVYALVYDDVPDDPKDLAKQMPPEVVKAASFADSVLELSQSVLDSLRRNPRSYLTLHIGPLLAQHPSLWEALLPSMRQGNDVWAEGFAALLDELGLVLRPEWTPRRLALALQAALDGFLLRYRIQPAEFAETSWEGAGIFADTVIAIVLGITDTDRNGESGRAALDRLASRPA